MSQPALFHHTPSWQLALLAAAGIAGSGFMAFQAGQPIAQLLSASRPSSMVYSPSSMVQPGQIAGSNSTVPQSDIVTSLRSQVANLVSRVAELEDSTKSDVVLGDSTETLPAREEFPPAVNLIRNSSFEENSDGAPRQWNYNQWSSSGNTFTTAEAIRTGSAGLKVLGSSTTNFGFSQPTTKMVEGRNYALSIWVKPVNTDSHTVKLSFWDELNNKEASAKTFSFTGTKEWSRLVLQISNKNTWNGKKWYPMVTVNGLNQGAVYFDDAQLEEASSYTPYHFEGGGATQSHVSVLGDGSVEIDAHGNVYPAVNGIGGLGTGGNKFAELKLSKATIDKNGSLTLEGDLTVDGNGTYKGAFNFSGTIKSHLIPDQDSTYDLGSSAKNWRVGYIDQLNLENRETINNNIDSDITFIENNTGGNNTLVFDLNAAADAVELRNDTEDLRLRAAGNANLVFRAGDAATDSTVNANDIFIASEDDTIMRADTFNLTVSASDAASIALRSTNGGIDLSTGTNSGLGTANLTLRSGGTLALDSSSNNSNILIDSGTGDLIVNVGTHTEVAQDNTINAISLSASRGGINLSSSSASGSGDIKLRSAGTLHLDTSANNANIWLKAGTGQVDVSSTINLTAGGYINWWNTVGSDGIGIRDNNGTIEFKNNAGAWAGIASSASGGGWTDDGTTIRLDTGTDRISVGNPVGESGGFDVANDYSILLRAGFGARQNATSGANDFQAAAEDAMILDAGDFTLAASEDAVAAVAINASRGGISLSSSSAGGSGDIKLRSAGTLHLDTSANNTNILANTGTGRLVATSNNAGITAIQLLATNGGIDISTSGLGGLGELRLRSGGSLKIDTSGNNQNILVDSGTGDLLANVGTTTLSAVDDAINAISLSATRGGINLSSSNASGSGDIKIRSAGTLHLDTSAAGSSILVNTGTGRLIASSGGTGVGASAAISLLATNGGIDLSTSGAAGNGDLRLRSAGTLQLDTSASDTNILVIAGGDTSTTLALRSDRGGIDVSSSSASGAGDIKLRSAGTLHLDTSANNTNILANTGQGRLVATSNNAGITAIQLLATNGGIDISTSGLGGLGELRLRSGGSLKIDTSGNNQNILVDSGTGDLLANVGTTTLSAVDDAINAISLSATRGGINLSSSSASGSGDIKLRSAGTLHLDTSANNTNILANTGQGRLVATSNNAGITAIQLLTTNGGIDISTSGLGGLGELRLRSGGSLKIDTSANNNNVLLTAGTGAFTVNAGASTHTYTGAYAVTDTAQISLTSNQAAINSVALLATNGGIDISTSGLGGVGELRLRSGGSLKLDTSGNNNNILVDSGTGDLLANVGTTTLSAVDDTINAISLSATRGGINLSSSNASGSGDIKIRSAGTLHLDTSAAGSSILVNTGTGRLIASSGGTGVGASAAISLLATNGGIDLSTSGAAGNGDLRLRSAGTLQLDTSASDTNILVIAGGDTSSTLALRSDRGGIDVSSSAASGAGNITVRSAGTLQLDTSAANSNLLMRTGTGTVDVSSGLVHVRSQNEDINAIRLLADRGGINISSGSAAGNGNITIKSAGTLTLDTSATNSNIMVRAGTGRIDLSGNTILINSGAGTLDLSSNSTIKIVSSTTASLWGETGTVIGRAGQLTTAYGRMCIRGSDGGAACPAGSDGRLFVQVTGETSGDDPGDVFDLAEYYPASEAIDPGTVVVADASARATVKKSAYPYQRVLGVASTTPAIRINEGSFEVGGSAITGASVKPLIALVGRVPVKVTNENGAIKVGDRLVASSTAGYAMKAVKQGMTLGMALEDIDFTGATEAKVMTFVNVSWYFPEVVAAIEAEHATSLALGTVPDPVAATADALAAAEGSDPSVSVDGSDPSKTLAAPSLTVSIPPTEFPNITVADTLTVGKSLIVNGTAKFEGTVEVLSDATFAKSVIIVGNLRIGGNLEIAGAVVTSFTAGSSLSAGDPVSVNASGQAVKAGGTNAVVGVAAGAAGAGDKVNVAVAGKVGGLSGLTAGSRYYVSESGALTTDGKGGQAVGVAVSGTELLVQPGVGLPAEASAEAGLPASPEPTPTLTETPISPIAPTPTAVPTAVPTEVPAELSPTPTPTVTP